MNKILYISAHLPCSKIPEAGQRTSEKYIKEYSNNGHNVDLLCFANDREGEYCRYVEDNKNIKKLCIFKLSNFHRLINIILHLFLPLCFAIRCDIRFKRILLNMLSENEYDKVVVDYTSMLIYIPLIKKYVSDISAIEVDITFQGIFRKYEQSKGIKKIFWHFEYLRQKRKEVKLLQEVNEIVVLCEKDKNIIDEYIHDKKITIAYPVIDSHYYELSREKVEKGSIVFWGAMNRNENVEAVRWFVEEMYPHILSEIEYAHFYVVGAHPDKSIVAYNDHPNITVTGFVDQPDKYFEMAQVGVIPLKKGAGIKVKAIEMLAAGIPLVSTVVGIEGVKVSSNNIVKVCNANNDFVDEVISMIKGIQP